MRITLIGSARFEKAFKDLEKTLTLCGHTVYGLARYPSDEGRKDWYTEAEKEVLDLIHLKKILDSDAVLVIDFPGPDGKPYIGDSTRRELRWSGMLQKPVYRVSENPTHLTMDGLTICRAEFSVGFSDDSKKFDFGLNYVGR